MSIINQMLRDLAQRQSPPSHGSTAVNTLLLHAVASRNHFNLRTVIWVTTTAFIVLALVWRLWPHLAVQHPINTAQALKHPLKLQVKPQPVMTSLIPATPSHAALNILTVKPVVLNFPRLHIHATDLSTPSSAYTLPERDLQDAPPHPPVTLTAASQLTNDNQSADTLINKHINTLTPLQVADNEYAQAYELAQTGKIDDAEALLRQILVTQPQHHTARKLLVYLLVKNKNNTEADQLLSASLAQQADQVDFAMLLARIRVEDGDLKGGINVLQTSLSYADNNADYHALLASLLQRNSQSAQAVAQYVSALKLNPQSGAWWMGLGIAESTQQHDEIAHDAFTHAIDTHTLSPELQSYVQHRLQTSNSQIKTTSDTSKSGN